MRIKNSKASKRVRLSELTPLEKAKEYRRRGRELIRKAKELEEYVAYCEEQSKRVTITRIR